jgi:hypothetical protein
VRGEPGRAPARFTSHALFATAPKFGVVLGIVLPAVHGGHRERRVLLNSLSRGFGGWNRPVVCIVVGSPERPDPICSQMGQVVNTFRPGRLDKYNCGPAMRRTGFFAAPVLLVGPYLPAVPGSAEYWAEYPKTAALSIVP